MTSSRRAVSTIVALIATAVSAVAILIATAPDQRTPAAASQIEQLKASGGPTIIAERFTDRSSEVTRLQRTDRVTGSLMGGGTFVFETTRSTARAKHATEADGSNTPGAPNTLPTTGTMTLRVSNDDKSLTAALREALGDDTATVVGDTVRSDKVVILSVDRSRDETVMHGVLPAEVCELPDSQRVAGQHAACERAGR